ncbi:MAG: protein kinase [Armatimonadota bacterium]|nr:MAG: protein kinase [Armatimonadota bacterium]
MALNKVGDYTITRELGQGGMGKVCQAVSESGEQVAVKTVIWPEGLDARARWETVERFQREARATRSLDHPNICRVLDIGADESTFFIVMEFLDGETVAELIAGSGALGAERAVEIMLSVCDALAYAHERGVIHRDIKPDNIMVLRDGKIKLMDFGLASIAYETSVTQTGTTMGTYFYMSPEQARGEKVDARSDIFSLGATFYEMLTGRRPFEGESPGLILNEILTKEPEIPTGLPPHLARTLRKCLRKGPAYRCQNVGEIVDMLRMTGSAPAAGGTMVLPGKRPASGPEGAGGSGTRPTISPAQSRPSAARPTGAAAGRSASGFRCSKCSELVAANAPSCWRCGTPNPAIAQRKSSQESRTAIQSALQDLQRKRKKRGWFGRRR